jgi:ferritin-like metal-binding protein YciE
MAQSTQEHLVTHLWDAHAVELQSIRQLQRVAEKPDEESPDLYEEHLEQSKAHEQKIRELVEARGHEPSPIEDKTLRGGAAGLRQIADIPFDTPVKRAMNLFALEHLEIATYGLLAEIARATDDEEVAQEAERILQEEQAAAEKIQGTFDRAVERLLEARAEEDSREDEDARKDSEGGDAGQAREDDAPQTDAAEESRADDEAGKDEPDEAGKDEPDEHDGDNGLLLAHLRDVHALELQSLQLLQVGLEEICQDEELEGMYREHLEQTGEHEQLINERIEAREAKPSAVRDLHMSAATSGLRDLMAGPPDAQAKLAMNVFCVEHLEVAAYELLARLAKHCGDDDTVQAAEKILEQERAAAEAVQNSFERTAQLMLESDGSYASVRSAETPE